MPVGSFPSRTSSRGAPVIGVDKSYADLIHCSLNARNRQRTRHVSRCRPGGFGGRDADGSAWLARAVGVAIGDRLRDVVMLGAILDVQLGTEGALLHPAPN